MVLNGRWMIDLQKEFLNCQRFTSGFVGTIILYSNIITQNFQQLSESMDVKIAELYSLAGHGRAGHLGESQAVAGVLGQGGPINKV